jgi:hypothetical protein
MIFDWWSVNGMILGFKFGNQLAMFYLVASLNFLYRLLITYSGVARSEQICLSVSKVM